MNYDINTIKFYKIEFFTRLIYHKTEDIDKLSYMFYLHPDRDRYFIIKKLIKRDFI